MAERHLQCDTSLATIVRPAALWWDAAVVVERAATLDAPLAALEERLRAGAVEPSATVRAMYRKLGLDPTKTRPSSEALLRRVRRGEPLPRVNALVDLVNWCSVEFQLPYGLYDRTAIHGTVALRLGRDGEQYPGIGKGAVHVAGRLVLADRDGPFGNPTSDSARTRVTSATREALVVIYAPAALPAGALARALDETAGRLALVCGGTESGRWMA